jgi:transposase
MIVLGVDVHKQSVTAVAVDEAGRMLDERTVPVGSEELIGWAAGLDAMRLWALEDCRLLTPWLERQLLGLGEELVRVSPKLTVPERRAGRVRGKSDPIDAARGRQGSAAGARPAKTAALRHSGPLST